MEQFRTWNRFYHTLAAVVAADLGPVLLLSAVLGEMPHLLAVAALDVVEVAWLWAILAHVARILATILGLTRFKSMPSATPLLVADDLARVGALALPVALFTAICTCFSLVHKYNRVLFLLKQARLVLFGQSLLI